MNPIPLIYTGGRVFYSPEFVKYTNGNAAYGESGSDSGLFSSFGIDTSHMHHLSVHVNWALSTGFSSASISLYGSNIHETDGCQVRLADAVGNTSSVAGNTSMSLTVQNNGNAIATFKDLPRWAKVVPVITGIGSTVGTITVGVFGWLE